MQFLRYRIGNHEEDESSAVFSHSFDCFRGNELGGENEICFAFSGVVIIDENKVSVSEGFDSVLYRVNRFTWVRAFHRIK